LYGFWKKNKILYREDDSKRIADNALVALTLMITESKPDEKDMMVKVVVNLLIQITNDTVKYLLLITFQ